MTSNKRRDRSALAKAFAVLEVLGDKAAPASMSEIARSANLPTSTVHRILHELTELKFLHRESTGEFSATTRLWAISTRSNPTSMIRQAAFPALFQLHALTQAHVLLTVRDDNASLIAERVGSDKNTPVTGRAGARLPLHATSSGKALLAFNAEPVLADLEMTKYTSHTLTTADELQQHLTIVRQDGVAYSNEEFMLDTLSAAAPVLDPEGTAIAALSVITTPESPFSSATLSAIRHFARIASETFQRLKSPLVDPPQPGLPKLV